MTTQTRAKGNAERVGGVSKSGGASDPGRFELLESKLAPPQLLDGSILRSTLVETLEDSAERRVVLVSAAPGYGKTTALAQWMQRSSRPIGWINLDERDNDPVVLLSYVATALDRIEELSQDTFEALSSATASVDGLVFPRLGSALAGMKTPFVLVLDDAHDIRDPQCLDAIDLLVDHLPGGSQLVLSGQVQPSRRVGALRAHGQLLELGPKQLRMDKAEASDLLAGAGVELGDDDLIALVEKTEGWPGGLYLAALSIREAGGTVASFGGDDRLVTDYLRDELLAGMPREQLGFLTAVSPLDEMCGDLCDSVLGTNGSAATLESLERSNLFVVPLDQRREWFRFHRLFGDLLRTELDRNPDKSAPELLGRASDWCAENERPDDAMRYAQAAEDTSRVAGLVAGRVQQEYALGRAATVDGWLSWLEERDALTAVPLVAALGSWFSALRGNPGQAERWANAAEAAPEGVAGNGASSIEPWLALLRAARSDRGIERMQADAALAAASVPVKGPWWPSAASLLALAYLLNGESDRADDLFADIAESAPAAEAWNAFALALAQRGILAADRGQWPEAEAFATEASQVVRRADIGEYPPNALVDALCARVAAHRGEPDLARESLTRAQRLRPQLTHALLAFSVQTRLELAAAYISLADTAGARTVLREADGLMRRGMGFGSLEDRARELHASLKSAHVDAPGSSSLTSAELRLLPYLPTHLSFREIGERLYLSRHTIKSEAMAIYRKLDVTSRNDAVERARTLGLLEA